MARTIGKVYWHVGNSGVTFEVIDEGYGPTFVVSTSSFGNLANEQKFYTDLKSLEALKALLEKALEQGEWSEGYCNPAEISDEEYKDTVEGHFLLSEKLINDVINKKSKRFII